MNFFTVCPGRPVYDIGSPIFDETRLTLAGGRVFTITARNVSAANKYIQSATMNGKALNKPWFDHSDIARERHLSSLKGRSEEIWSTVGVLVATRQPKSYDLAVQRLTENLSLC